MASAAESIFTIDCHYVKPGRVAAYLLVEDGQAAFVDNNTNRAVPHLLAALEAHSIPPEQVRYLILTHVHLDHAGGTAALLGACPNARVLAHPRALRHLVDPSRLIESARMVYGDALFDHLYGDIAPVPEDRVQTMADEDTLAFGRRTLTFLHVSGHARHHMCILDSASRGVFTGDAFGIGYQRFQKGTKPFIMASSPPIDFDPIQAREGVRRLANSGAETAYLGHFGPQGRMDCAAAQLMEDLTRKEAVLDEAESSGPTGDALVTFCENRLKRAAAAMFASCGLKPSPKDWEWLSPDIRIDAKGLAFTAQRRRKGQ
jgi:glyoxylase-like metal-dependent hydrolase (beta-lactamase superfamily II)